MAGSKNTFRLTAFLLVGISLWQLTTPQARSQQPNRAAVVVRFDENRVATRCVTFDEPAISGYEVLSRSGLALGTRFEGSGGLVCQIEETGCPSDDCLCQCGGGDACVYWSYWRQIDGSWRYAQLGASSTLIPAGGVEGWSWGPGTVAEAIEPPPVTFEEICGPDSPRPTSVVAADSEEPTEWNRYVPFGLIMVVFGLFWVRLRRTGS